MTELPSYEPDEVVTRGILRAELAELETRLTRRMGAGFLGLATLFVATTAILR